MAGAGFIRILLLDTAGVRRSAVVLDSVQLYGWRINHALRTAGTPSVDDGGGSQPCCTGLL